MIPSLKSPLLSQISSLQHGFFTREGGVSEGDYATLNAGREKGDNPKHVEENRRRISESLGFEVSHLVTVRQRHSATVVVVDRPFEGHPPEADGVITTTPGILVGVLTADCVPVLLSTPQGNVVAAVHAGWRGAVDGILETTIAQMKDLGAHEIIAALGPCIWQDTYEVSQEFYEHLSETPSFFCPSPRPDHWQFDLPGYVMHRLKASGIDALDPSPANTYTDPMRFFSYRRKTILGEAQFGCSLSAIGITL